MPNTSATPRSYSTPYFGRSTPSSVPRPTGRIAPAPRDYPSASQSRGSYSARSYGGGGNGGYRGYSAPHAGSYGGGSYGGRSYSAPSSHSSGSYHGSSASHGSSGSHGHSGGGSHGGHR
jgi:hypothetical protein